MNLRTLKAIAVLLIVGAPSLLFAEGKFYPYTHILHISWEGHEYFIY